MSLDFLPVSGLEALAVRIGLVILVFSGLWLAQRALFRLVLPRLRRLAHSTSTEADDALLDAVRMPLQLLVWALAVAAASTILWAEPPTFATSLTRTLIIVAIFTALYKAIGLIMRSARGLAAITGIRIDEQLLPFLRTMLKAVVVVLAVLTVLGEWQYDIGGLIAGLGVSGLAVALAAENTVANVFGFATIVGDRPLAVGEYISTPDVTGTVEHVGFRTTRIRQLDRALVTIPNSKLAGSVVTNWSRLTQRRLDMTIGLTYSTTSAQMRALLAQLEALLRSREAVAGDTVTVLFTGFGDSALNVRLIAYLQLPDWKAFMQEQQEIMLQIMDIVAAMGLSFAYPSQSVYIEQAPRAAENKAEPAANNRE